MHFLINSNPSESHILTYIILIFWILPLLRKSYNGKEYLSDIINLRFSVYTSVWIQTQLNVTSICIFLKYNLLFYMVAMYGLGVRYIDFFKYTKNGFFF